MRIAFLTTGLIQYTSLIANPMAETHPTAFVGLDCLQETSDGDDFGMIARSRFRPEVEVCLLSHWRKRDIRNLWAVAGAVRFLRRWGPDIIHLQADADYRIYLAMLAMRHIPYVDTVHDAQPHLGEDDRYTRKPDWPLRLRMRRHAARLIVHGQSIKELLARSAALPPDKISVIPHPAYELYGRYRDQDIVPAPNEVLFFGRIWPYKGLDVLVRAEPIISAAVPEVKFVIAGEGEDLAPYRAAMVHPERFEVHNRFLRDEEAAHLLQRAAIVVAPYREASQSGVVSAAYAMGRPVVVTNVGALAEAVQHGETGLVVPPDDPLALAAAIVQLLTEPDLRQRMGQAASALANGRLSASSIAAKTLEVYESVIQEHRHRKRGEESEK